MVEKMKCQKCGLMVCHPCVSGNAPAPERRVVVVASDRALSRTSHFHRLAVATRALGIPRREIPNWIADVIFGFEGDILSSDGALIELSDTDIDEAFGDDGSFRWLSDFLRFAEAPPKQAPQDRILPRLRLIDLAFRVAYPDRAALIGK